MASCRLEELRRPLKKLIRKHRGHLLEISGGELFAYFHSALGAFLAASDLQRKFTGHVNKCSLRIGLHLGEVQISDRHVYGNDVIIASRVMEMARPGGICLSGQAYQHIYDRTDTRFVLLGKRSLKNINGRTKVYTVLPDRWCSRLGLYGTYHRTASFVRGRTGRVIFASMVLAMVYYLAPAAEQKSVNLDETVSYLSVAGFNNLTPDKVPDYVSHGVEEAVKSQLASVSGLYLVPEQNRTGAPVQLRVSLQQHAASLRASYRIINLADGMELAGDMVEGDRADLFHLQDKLADGIVTDLAGILALNDMDVVRPNLTEDNKAYAYYLQARDYLDMPGPNRHLDYASRLFQASLEVDPRFARAMAGLCEILWLKYELNPLDDFATRAEESCRQAQQMDPELVDVQLALGRLYEGKGRHQQAIEAYQRAMSLDPRSDQAYRGLSRVYLALDEPDKALSTYARAIELHPGYWLNYKELGNLHLRLGRATEAERWYRDALTLTPDNVDVYSNLGAALFLQGRFGEAMKAYRHSLSLKPTAAAYAGLGDVYDHTGDYVQAYLMHQQAVEASPGNYLYWARLASSRRQLYDDDEGTSDIHHKAIELARKSLLINPRNAGAWMVIALANAYLGQPDEALLSMRRGMELAPGLLEMKYQSALVWNALGEKDRALEVLEDLSRDGFSMKVAETSPELKLLFALPGLKQTVMALEGSEGILENPAGK